MDCGLPTLRGFSSLFSVSPISGCTMTVESVHLTSTGSFIDSNSESTPKSFSSSEVLLGEKRSARQHRSRAETPQHLEQEDAIVVRWVEYSEISKLVRRAKGIEPRVLPAVLESPRFASSDWNSALRNQARAQPFFGGFKSFEHCGLTSIEAPWLQDG